MSIIDRLIEHRLRGELTQAIQAVLSKAQEQGHVPDIGPAAAAYMADAALAVLMAIDDAHEQLRRDGMLNEE